MDCFNVHLHHLFLRSIGVGTWGGGGGHAPPPCLLTPHSPAAQRIYELENISKGWHWFKLTSIIEHLAPMRAPPLPLSYYMEPKHCPPPQVFLRKCNTVCGSHLMSCAIRTSLPE